MIGFLTSQGDQHRRRLERLEQALQHLLHDVAANPHLAVERTQKFLQEPIP